MYDLVEIVTRNFISKAPCRSLWKAAAAASVSPSPVRAWRRRRPCQSQITAGRRAPAALTWAPAAPKLGACGPWPQPQGRWPRGGGRCFGATARPSRAPPSHSCPAAPCSMTRMKICLTKSLRRQSSPRTGQAEVGASEPDSSGHREAGPTWISLWFSMRCEPGAGVAGINTPCCSKTPPGSRCGRLWGTEAAATAVNKLHWPGTFSCEPGSPTVLVGCWFVSGLEMTGWEGNGTPLQYSCLENPMEGGAWWAAVHGVAKSRTRLSGFIFTFMHWRRKWQPTPVFLPGESQGRGSLVGCRLWCHTELEMTEVT